MGYQDLGGPTPINYRPDDDSAMLAIGDALKVQKVCNAIKNDRQRNLKEGKRRNKKKRVKKQTSTDVGTDSVVADKAPSDSENLIMVGGIAGYDECFRPHKKTYKQFREEVESILFEKKSKRKGRSKNSGTVDQDPRSKKIQKLKNNDSHWRGLE